ncbi:MAG: hypothetical protein ACJ71A_03685 [Nitrososphaeraceae archaeon]
MFPDGHLVVPGVGSDNAKNNNHEQSIGKTSATLEPKYRGSKIKQPHRGVQPNEPDIYMSNQYKNSQTPLSSANVPIRVICIYVFS